MARVALQMSVDRLAVLSGIGPTTIRRLESPDRPGRVKVALIEKLQHTFEGEGVTFLVNDGVHGAGVRYLDQVCTDDAA